MQNIANKTDGVDTLPATDFNSHKNELQALVTESGQTLAIGTTDQLRKAVSIFSRSLYCSDSSGAANTLTLSRPTALTDINAYYDGMVLMFDTPNANTGATTATVNGLASKKVRTAADADLASGAIVSGVLYTLVYKDALDSGAGAFELTTQTTGAASDTRLNTADEDYAGQVAGEEILNSNAGEWIKNQCSAWVTFDGLTGGVATIKDKFNVASVVRNSLGNYTITFSVAMANVNYVMVGTAAFDGNADIVVSTTKAVGSVVIDVYNVADSSRDNIDISLAFFGGRV